MNRDRVLAVIPARYSSTRFPGKPLVSIAGKPMVAQVVARALEAGCFDEVLVATDDQRIAQAAAAASARPTKMSRRKSPPAPPLTGGRNATSSPGFSFVSRLA
jgi:CMP-2-keto-3-deoxyoctulosonic acid synthetase